MNIIADNDFAGIFHIQLNEYVDNRGSFMELGRTNTFKEQLNIDIVQQNMSVSYKNVIRGLHFQKGNNAQGKLVHCLGGKIIDVVVDLRKESPTFLKHKSFILSRGNLIYIPPQFAHGFAVRSDMAYVQYGVTSEYCKSAECGIIYNDKDLNIAWNIKTPILSGKDIELPTLQELKQMDVFF